MARVYVDTDNSQWVHADTGNRISVWDVRNQEPHASEVQKRVAAAGGDRVNTKTNNRIAGAMTDQSQPWGQDENDQSGAPVPPAGFTEIEEAYVEEILAESTYV